MLKTDQRCPAPRAAGARSPGEPSVFGGVNAGPGAAAAILAAWTAAGSVGLMSHALRGALVWLAVALSAMLLFPRQSRRALVFWGAGVLLAVFLLALGNPLAAICAPAALCAAASLGHDYRVRAQLATVATAIAILAIFRLAVEAIPWFWLLADRAAEVIGQAGGAIAGQRLWVGLTFAGLDFLLPMLVIIVGWKQSAAPSSPGLSSGVLPQARGQGILHAAAIGVVLLAHLLYLVLLAWSPTILKLLPPENLKEPATWADTVRMLVPWDLPAIAALLHACVLLGILRRPDWDPTPRVTPPVPPQVGPVSPAAIRYLPLAGATALAILLPVLCQLWLSAPSLTGKKIVAYEKGFLNWLKPTHKEYGRLAAGMYGMMPDFVHSLGASFARSPDLLDEELRGASALLVIFPNEPWPAEMRARIDRFVENGGSLLVLADHTTHQPELYVPKTDPTPQRNRPVQDGISQAPFNDLLEKTAMRVRFDSALFAVGGWLNSYLAISHPTVLGIGDDRNSFGVVTGASVQTRWPARPILIGRWGWNDPGDEGAGAAMMGNHHYDPGERLGDLILVSEQPVGRGKVIVFGDTSTFTNNITYGAHPFNSRLFAYLAAGGQAAHPATSQVAAMLLALVAAAGLAWRRRAAEALVFALVLGLASAVCIAATARAQSRFPAADPARSVRVAYVDASHMEGYSAEALRPKGLMGMLHTLERNGYLALAAPDLSSRRLRGASVLISIAPGRRFTATERANIRSFIENGGIFISMVGYDRGWASEELLAELGFFIAQSPPANGLAPAPPEPMGHFKSPYVQNAQGDRRALVRFWAGWPVCSNDPAARVLAYGRDNQNAIMMRPLGKGKVVVIGDSDFATTKNLEMENGELIEGARENADFWRWLLPYLREERDGWLPWDQEQDPPNPATRPPGPSTSPASRRSDPR